MKANRYIKLVDKNTIIHKIYDNKTYTDQYCIEKNFTGMTKSIKSPSAWEKSFLYIKENNLLEYNDWFWFIEDDVYIPNTNLLKTFNNIDTDLLTNSLSFFRSEIWKNHKVMQKDLMFFNAIYIDRTFNVICRLSNRLIEKVFEFQETYNTFVFHEILFPSLSNKYGYQTILFKELKNYHRIFGYMKYRPIISKLEMNKNFINHPVKDL